MNPTPIWLQPKRIVAATVSAALLMQSGIPAYAAVSQNPAVYTAQPDANVMFSLDDSGSMKSDVIPDLALNDAGFPKTTATSAEYDVWKDVVPYSYFYGYCTSYYGYKGCVAYTQFPTMWVKNSGFLQAKFYQDNNTNATDTTGTTADEVNRAVRFLRSPATNPLYYDRTVTYVPWPDPAADSTKQLANADPAAVSISYHDPRSADSTIDLTAQATDRAVFGGTLKYWPATYYNYSGPTYPVATGPHALTENVAGNFEKVEITNVTSSTYKRQTKTEGNVVVLDDHRTDCGTALTCTRAQELQNFANWLQYYHSRMLMAKGGVSAAFAKQRTNLRVGFATINQGVLQGVSTFSGAARTGFFEGLYDRNINGGTPLREAMDKVGKYFTLPASPSTAQLLNSPYAFTPKSVHLPEYDCRKSFHILSTDGYWNGNAASAGAAADNDNFKDTDKTPPRKTSNLQYSYSDAPSSSADPLVGRFTINPFRDNTDSQANTLADVAAYYWKTDLYPGLANNLSPTARDPAFWQHLTTFTVGLGITGTGAVPGLDKPDTLITKKQVVDWPTVTGGSKETGDDLIRASMVGRGRYFSATNPSALAAGLASALAEATDQPLSLSSLAPASGTYALGNKVFQATFNPNQWYGRLYSFNQAANGSVDTTPSLANWEASNKLPAHAVRKIYSFNPTTKAGSLFDLSAGGLTPDQQTKLGSGTDVLNVLNYLRGDDSKEVAKGGTYRDRSRYTVGSVTGGPLGDIVNSSPVIPPVVGAAYQNLPAGMPGKQLYPIFRSPATTALADSLNTIFVGANDGMLHAFNKTDGVERFAYVPNSVFSVPRSASDGTPEARLKMLTDPSYSHRFTVDGSPQVSDAFFGDTSATGEWRTVLNSSTGVGARSIFVMDVTRTAPGTDGFGPSKILWEFSDADDPENMGYSLGYGHVALTKGKRWVLIFGNGYDSVKGQAVLYIRDLFTGVEVATIKVGVEGGNGLSQPNFTTKDRQVEFIYAGDLKGSLWKFDVTADDPADWKATELFAGSDKQPITVMPTIGFKHPNGGNMISFGTGKLFETEDQDSDIAKNVNLNTQTIYGIWDKPGASAAITGTSLLVEQKPISQAAAADTTLSGTSSNTVDWATKRGWYLNLGAGGERVHVNPQLPVPGNAKAPLFVVANRPAAAVPCETGGTARIFALDPYTGAAPSLGPYDANGSNTITVDDKGYNVWSLGTMVTQPVFQTKGATGGVTDLEPGGGGDGRTGARDGGREDLSKLPCDQVMTVGKSDTDTDTKNVLLCPKTGRISWRQIQ